MIDTKKVDLNLVYEDEISGLILRKILTSFSDKFNINNEFGKTGNGYIRKNIKNFNYASKVTPFLVLTDLDMHECPIQLIEKWLDFKKDENLIFRIAVREIESWVIADAEGIAEYFKIDKTRIPKNPDQIIDSKQTLINLAKLSKSKTIKSGIVPRNGSTSKQGIQYNILIGKFIRDFWKLERAKTRSESLQRATNALTNFTP